MIYALQNSTYVLPVVCDCKLNSVGFASELYEGQISGLWVLGTVSNANTILAALLTLTAGHTAALDATTQATLDATTQATLDATTLATLDATHMRLWTLPHRRLWTLPTGDSGRYHTCYYSFLPRT